MQGDRAFLLRPMGVGELLDAAVKLYRQNWKPLMAVVAFVMVPYSFLQAFATRSPGRFRFPSNLQDEPSFDQSSFDRAFVFGIAFGLVTFLLVQPFLAGAVARAAYSLYLGEDIDVRQVYRVALSLLFPILWVSLLAALGVVIGLILLVVPGIIAAIRFTFGTVVLVIEERRGTRALRRSWDLAKGKFWRILGTILLAQLVASVVGAVVAIPFTISLLATGSSAWPLQGLGSAVAAVITTPFVTLVHVLLYFDMRIRKEGFDLAVMAHELGRTDGAR